jgi:hypothetical protein
VDFAGGGGTCGVEIEVVERVSCGVVREGGVLRGEEDALGGGEGVAGWDDGEEDVGGVEEGEVGWVGFDGGGEGAALGCFAGGRGLLLDAGHHRVDSLGWNVDFA